MKYLRKNDCIMLVFSVVLFAVLQLLITERILSSFWQLNLLIIGINIILAASLNLINGYTGQFSLGHAGFMAVGAYVGVVLTANFHMPFAVALIAGGIAAGFLGFLVGIPTLRLRGDYLAIATLGLGSIKIGSATSRDRVYGGGKTAGEEVTSVKCMMHHLCFFLRCRTQISVQHFIISFMKCFRKTNCLNAHRPSPTDAASFRNQLQCKGKCLFFGLYIMSLHLTGLQILYHLLSEQIISLCNEFIHYSTTWIHPSGASIRPIWIPVSVSRSFAIVGPICSIPLGKQISSPWLTILPTGEITAAVPHRPHSAKSFTSSK